jgi:hypothetical protein
MFYKKYTLTLLNSKWEVLKKNLPITFIPKKDEFIWIDYNPDASAKHFQNMARASP